jgi:hypothetical protein
MAGSWNPADLPNLTGKNHTVTSLADNGYNCIAWAAGDATAWWWPANVDSFWPPAAPNEVTIEAFLGAYGTLGYVECRHRRYEVGFEKVAIYARYEQGLWIPTHAARQLPDGTWTSKLGPLEDIAHRSVNDVNGPGPRSYGQPVRFMKRPSSAHKSRWALIAGILRDFFAPIFR